MNREDVLKLVRSMLSRRGWTVGADALEDLAAVALEGAGRRFETTWPVVAAVCLLRARGRETDRQASRLAKIDSRASQVAWWGARGRLGQAMAREQEALDMALALALRMPADLEARREAEAEREMDMWDACEGRTR